MSHVMKLFLLVLILTVTFAKNSTKSTKRAKETFIRPNATQINGFLEAINKAKKNNKNNTKSSEEKSTKNSPDSSTKNSSEDRAKKSSDNSTKNLSEGSTKKSPHNSTKESSEVSTKKSAENSTDTKPDIVTKKAAPEQKNDTNIEPTNQKNETKLEQDREETTNSTIENEIPPLSPNDSGDDDPKIGFRNITTKIDLIEDFTVELLENKGSVEEPSIIGKIFNKGKLAPYFRICATEDEARISEEVYPISHRDCFRDSGYTDHIEFKYLYPSTVFQDGNTVMSSAQIVHQEDSRSRAFISNKEARTLTASEPFGVVQIYYGCMENTTETLSLILEVKNITHAETIKMSWEKTCITGNPWHIKVRNKAPSKETILWPYEDVERNMFVSPSQMSSNLEVLIDHRYLQQYFMEPTLTASNTSIVVTSLRGTESKGGILHSGIPVNFNVMYACKGSGDSMVEFTMGIPPFQNVSFSWWKECGGKEPQNLMIGTESGTSDVVSQGLVQDPFSMFDWQLGMPHTELHKHLETNNSQWKLFVSTDVKEEASDVESSGLHMGQPLITLENPQIIYASTSKLLKSSKASYWKTKYNANDQTVVLRQDEELEVSFSLVCLRKGESRVFISLPLLHYDAVEFGFVKVCNHVPKKRRGFGITAMTALIIVVLVAIGSVSFVMYKRYKKRQELIRYEALAGLGS